MLSSLSKNISDFHKEKKEKIDNLKNKPILNMRSINEENISNVNESNFLEILELIVEDIEEYKEKVIEEKYYKKYAEKDGVKASSIKMIFKHLKKIFNNIMTDAMKAYELNKDESDMAMNNYIEIAGDPTSNLDARRDGILKTYLDRLSRIEDMMLLLDTQIDESQPEKMLSRMIKNISEKEIFAGALYYEGKLAPIKE